MGNIIPKESSEFCSVRYGPAPYGGVKTVAYFFNEKEEPCREDEANTIQILIYDKDDNCVFSLISEPKGN